MRVTPMREKHRAIAESFPYNVSSCRPIGKHETLKELTMFIPLLACCALGGEPAQDWQKQEAKHLKNIKQVTFGFVRAGEGYFSADGKRIIFQAEERGVNNPFYQIFTKELNSPKIQRVSTGRGKCTCAYFHPKGDKVIFASSHLDPDAEKHYGDEYKAREEEKKTKKKRKYIWDFDPYMDIFEARPDGSSLKNLTKSPGYDAEGSYSADGKYIVFCSNRSGKDNLELYVMDADGKNVRQLTKAPGCYNGGPFFSPDGKRVIFRSDRKKKDHLQLYVINSDGTGEKALTDDLNWVFWAPYWYKDGKHIIYTAANHAVKGRPNYDLWWMNVDTGKKVRITYHESADVLPVFSPDGTKLMWTSTRSPDGSSQLFIADFTPPESP
jgi:Tol biopolymer transport system component